ncbi:urea ABC transporter permease subunit UrtB [Phormidium sp. FACHB-592]|uniref:Urea ABC transporter permease subunit UrtB n=1 Tax=Stenomitos frigidus AS-A4 TaxID=2933935 RepID=A0ABV0KDA5_9CYAN|nr:MULTISPECIES: urea ABC transporter permease subunit UrtB [Cyanophyceae]MBD2037963.1 urea ABC transporter permease subunit UrtB [Leptolyngbya sp. FACHB-321]MBD2077836.1 urea ABC transporter permease subunit UrtB [Phormidium sp. FACHB-592]
MDFLSSLVYLAQSSPPAKSIDPIAFANQLLNGIGIIGILLLTGLGLAITFGVMRIINLAHGEFIMLGAYTTFVLQKNFKMDLLLTIPFAFLLTAVIGAIVEITIIRKLYGRPLETLLATWGLSIVLQGVVKLIFTAQLKYVKAPPYIKGNLSLFNAGGQSVEISYYRLFIFAVAIALLGLTAFLLYKTALGRQIRAVTQNREMTRCLGVNTSLVDMATFAYGCGLAGIAGSVISSLKSVAPPMGQDYLVDAWMTVVTGGVDKLIGVLAGSVLIGSANSAIAYLLNDPAARVIVLFSVIVLIRYRPEGLFTVQKRA